MVKIRVGHYRVLKKSLSILLFFGFLSLINTSALGHDESRNNELTAKSALSQRARTLSSRPWSESTLDEAVSVLSDKNELPLSRVIALQKVSNNGREMESGDIDSFLNIAKPIVQDKTESPRVKAEVISGISRMVNVQIEKYHRGKQEFDDIYNLLSATAHDDSLDDETRGAAIRAIGDLEVTSEAGYLRQLLMDQELSARPKLAQSSLIAIWRLEGEKAIDVISEELRTTRSEKIFGTAAFTLGEIETTRSVASLMQNEARFPDSGSIHAALVNMDEAVYGILANLNDSNLIYGIQATKYLWRKEQQDRYVSLLKQLLRTAPDIARKAAVERLFEWASTLSFEKEQEQLLEILGQIQDQPGLESYKEYIQSRLTSVPLEPTGVEMATPTLNSGGGE